MTPAGTRHHLGLSIQGMTDMMGINRGTWEKWEHGKRKPGAAAVTAMRLLVFIDQHGLLDEWKSSNRKVAK